MQSYSTGILKTIKNDAQSQIEQTRKIEARITQLRQDFRRWLRGEKYSMESTNVPWVTRQRKTSGPTPKVLVDDN